MKQLYENISGVVMAGGKSSRMGTDKGLLEFNGRPLVQHGIDLLTGCFSELYISTNHDDYEKFGWPIIPDIHKNCGPIGGIHAVLTSIKTDYVFILSCDMPFVDRDVLSRILINYKDFQVTVPRLGNKLEPLCAVYAKSLLPEIEKRIDAGLYKMHDLIHHSAANFIDIKNQELFFNINTPDDLNVK